MKKIFTLIALSATMVAKVNAQNGFSEIIKSTPDDAAKLLRAYSEPVFKGFGIGMNSGWHNTAKTKGLFKFEVRISATAVFVPQSSKSFDVTQINLSNSLRPTDPTKTIAPTAAGSKGDGPSLSVYDANGNKLESFNTPGGVSPVYGAPQIQATVGLPYNTDVTLRAMPKISFGSNIGSVSMLGAGLKHNIMADIVGKAAKIVPFDAAIAVGFTHINYSLPIDVKPYNNAQPKDAQQSTDFTNQHFSGNFDGFNIQAILSKKIMAITPFVALSYSSSNTYLTLQGNYPLTTGFNAAQSPTYTSFSNPINISEKSISGAQADIGFQLNLGVFRFYASYIAAQYQSVNAGIGFGL